MIYIKITNIIILLNPDKYLKLFFLNQDIKNVRINHLTKIDESITEYVPHRDSKTIINYIDLKNLSSICYMNSVIPINPTQINVQCDAKEFLSRFIEKIKDSLKNDNQKFLFSNNIFGGITLQKVKYTNPECGNISERREKINFFEFGYNRRKYPIKKRR